MDESLKQRPEKCLWRIEVISEKIFSWAKEIHNIDYVFLRYFNACGATDIYGEAHNPETHLIPLILQVAQGKRNEVKLFGDDYPTRDGTCIRDYIHVKDLAQTHILALKTTISGVYNLGNGEGYTVKEVIDVLERLLIIRFLCRSNLEEVEIVQLWLLILQKHEMKWDGNLSIQTLNHITSAWNWHQQISRWIH